MKIILGKQIEEIKKKNSENEKNLLKNRNSEDINDLDKDDIYFHSNTIKNIKLGTNTVNRIYLNNSIVYELENTIDFNLFHSLVPYTATEIRFLYASNNPDLTDYQRIGYCDNNNFIEVWNNGTKYILINPRKNYIYAPTSCSSLFNHYTSLTNCVLENFDTRNVTSMRQMFNQCSRLTSLDLSSFNTANVTDMYGCFAACNGLTSLDLSSFSTGNVTNMVSMFNSASSLKTIFSSSFILNSDLFSDSMFFSCFSLVGGNGTTYSRSHITADYARVDGENGLPGYFTAPSANNK